MTPSVPSLSPLVVYVAGGGALIATINICRPRPSLSDGGFLLQKISIMNIIKNVDRSRMRRRYWGIFTTIAVGFVLLLSILLVVFRLFGYEIYTVMSGSMEPNYHVGSLIYVKPVDIDELEENDVITFVADENNTIVTHRIVEVVNADNGKHFRTKGDANDVPDAKEVHYKNVLGRPEFSIPLLGYLAFHIQHPPGLYIAIVVAIGLLFVVFYPAIYDKRKEKAASKKEK